MSDTRRLLSPVAATLLRAADYIDAHGWCQHLKRDATGRVCAIGAIHSVNRGDTGHDAAFALRKYLEADDPWAVVEWNDAPGRTQAEVVAALRGAALQESSNG